MSKEEITELLDIFNIDTYNLGPDRCSMKGINGQVTGLYYDKDPLSTIKGHLIQMGRDSMAMDIQSLLSITNHN